MYRQNKREYAKAYYRKNRTAHFHRGRQRRQLIKKATIMSPEKERLTKLLYLEAQRLTLETGIEYVVDHIVPLKHRLVCGLHAYANLQCITAEQNRLKGNTFSIEDD
jgi:5-methylcytosine-specific restriction endonuclease McrA